jgi:hypothetical protein
MKNNPLVDVAAILLCILAVVLVGQYYIAKKDREVLQVPNKIKEEVPRPNLDMSKFEVSVKHTE